MTAGSQTMIMLDGAVDLECLWESASYEALGSCETLIQQREKHYGHSRRPFRACTAHLGLEAQALL